jgi:hypothetical protein
LNRHSRSSTLFAEPLTRRRNYITAVRTWVPGELVTASMMNTIRDLFLEIETGSIIALVDGATVPLNAALGQVVTGVFRLAANGNRSINVPTGATPARKIIIMHTAVGADRLLALSVAANGFRFGTDVAMLTATTSGKTDYIGAIWNSVDSKWDVIAYTKGF